MRNSNYLLFSVLGAFFLFSGCDSRSVGSNYRAVERDRVEFAQLLENVRFAGKSYAKGEKFELVRLSNGSKIAVMQRAPTKTDFLVSAVGPLLFSSSSWAVVLDGHNCTIGQGANLSGSGSPKEGKRIAVWDKYSVDDPQPVFDSGARFCFKII